MVLSQRVL